MFLKPLLDRLGGKMGAAQGAPALDKSPREKVEDDLETLARLARSEYCSAPDRVMFKSQLESLDYRASRISPQYALEVSERAEGILRAESERQAAVSIDSSYESLERAAAASDEGQNSAIGLFKQAFDQAERAVRRAEAVSPELRGRIAPSADEVMRGAAAGQISYCMGRARAASDGEFVPYLIYEAMEMAYRAVDSGKMGPEEAKDVRKSAEELARERNARVYFRSPAFLQSPETAKD